MSQLFQLLRQPRNWLLALAIVMLAGSIVVLNYTALAPRTSDAQLSEESFAVPSRRTTVEVRDKNRTGEMTRKHIFDIGNVEVETQIAFVNGDTATILWDKNTGVQTYTRYTRDGKQLVQVVTPIESPFVRRDFDIPYSRFNRTLLFTTRLLDANGKTFERYTHKMDGSREVANHLPDGKTSRSRVFAKSGLLRIERIWTPDGKRLAYEAEYREDGTLETVVELGDQGTNTARMYWPDGTSLYSLNVDTPKSTDVVWYRLDGSKWVREFAAFEQQPSGPEQLRTFTEVYHPNGAVSAKFDWGVSKDVLNASVYREDGTLAMRFLAKSPSGESFNNWRGIVMKTAEVFDTAGRLTNRLEFNEKGDAPLAVSIFKWDGSGTKRSLVTAENGTPFVRVQELDALGNVLATTDTVENALGPFDKSWLLPPSFRHPGRFLEEAEKAKADAAGK